MIYFPLWSELAFRTLSWQLKELHFNFKHYFCCIYLHLYWENKVVIIWNEVSSLKGEGIGSFIMMLLLKVIRRHELSLFQILTWKMEITCLMFCKWMNYWKVSSHIFEEKLIDNFYSWSFFQVPTCSYYSVQCVGHDI